MGGNAVREGRAATRDSLRALLRRWPVALIAAIAGGVGARSEPLMTIGDCGRRSLTANYIMRVSAEIETGDQRAIDFLLSPHPASGEGDGP